MARTGQRVSERQFQRMVLDLAKLCGWHVIHFRPARVVRGGVVSWRTPVEGDAKGLVDTILVRERVVWAELKVHPNRPTLEQTDWMEWLLHARCEVYCWYPEDWEDIERVLGFRPAGPSR